jgi:hypothetical protein
MALGHYQQTALTNAGTLLQGGWRCGVAASAATFAAGSLGTVLGIGNLTGITENLERTTTQAGNSDMPEEKVAVQSLTITFELLEFWLPTFDEIRGGSLDTENAATTSTYITGTPSANTLSTGGLNTLTGKAFAFENTTLVDGATAQTLIIIYKAKVEEGITFTPKTDHDTDPAMVIPFTITAELDTSRTKGDQLFIIESQLGLV